MTGKFHILVFAIIGQIFFFDVVISVNKRPSEKFTCPVGGDPAFPGAKINCRPKKFCAISNRKQKQVRSNGRQFRILSEYSCRGKQVCCAVTKSQKSHSTTPSIQKLPCPVNGDPAIPEAKIYCWPMTYCSKRIFRTSPGDQFRMLGEYSCPDNGVCCAVTNPVKDYRRKKLTQPS